MVIKEVELLFQAEALDVPIIKQHAQSDGWTVTLNGTHKLNPLFETARGKVRLFKRLDAVVMMLFEIGFNELKIIR